MHDSSRLYSCLSCHCIIIICTHCDRGNIYCKQCAPVRFLRAKQRANKRYQATYKGRLNHAARQKRYRERLKQKVTYQGFKARSVRDLLVDKGKCVKTLFNTSKKSHIKDIFCHCCNKICSPFLRDGWLSDYDHKKRHKVFKAKKLIFG
jgi:hypothetical protein